MAKVFVGMFSSYSQNGFALGNRFAYSSKQFSKKVSGIIFASVVIAHGVSIVLVLNTKLTQKENKIVEPILHFIQLSPEKYLSITQVEEPVILFQLNTIHRTLPDIYGKDIPAAKLDLTHYQSSTPYELPNKNDQLYSDIFDPKLRKKLQDAHANRKPERLNTLNTWETPGGTRLVDMGGGECMASMPQMDLRDRG